MFAVLLTGCGADPPSVDPEAAPADETAAWPRFHGADGTNVSSDTGLLTEWPDGGPKLAMAVEGVGEGFAGATIAGGLIYTAGNVGGEMLISAIELDGTIRWQTANGKAWAGSYRGSRGTPTVDGDHVYHENPYGDVICLDAATGGEVWSMNLRRRFGSTNIRWALSESVLIDGDRVICCPGGPEATVVALDKGTGETVWQSESTGDPPGYGSPALAEQDGLRMILTMTGRAVIAVNADTGELLWRFGHKTQYDVNALMPVFHDGRVFISTSYGSGSVMLQIHVDGDSASVEEVWRNGDLANHHGGVLLHEGYLYGTGSGGDWMCVDWQSGKTMYTEEGVGKGSLTVAEGMLYTLSEDAVMGLVPATPDAHRLVGRFDLPDCGDGKSWAHPVVCGGRLYIRHGDYLYGYDIKAGE